jgi:hypothetical protein
VAPAVTAAATTTTTHFETLSDRIAAVVVRYGRQTITCVSAPTKCDVAAITATEGSHREIFTRGVAALVGRHWEARENADDPYYDLVSRVQLSEDQRSAIVSTCTWDPVFLWEVHGASDGSDVLANNARSTSHREYTVFLEGGEWRVGEIKVLDKVEGQNKCAPRS